MAKTTTENKDLNSKNLSTPKDGFIQKKKSQKFKQTPTGKIPLINGSKASNNNNNMKKQELQKQKNSSPQKFSEKNKEKSSKTKKVLSKKSPKKSKSDSFDSDEDINEGIVLKEQELMEETDDTESEEESEHEQEKSVPNILGTSLADDTEEDDEEFTVEDKKGKIQVNKGVKMFKGLKSNNKSNDSLKSSDRSSMESSAMDDSDEDEDEDEDEDKLEMEEHEEESDDEEVEEEEEEEDEDEDEEESENEGAESALGISALLGNSIADDDDDDEDFVEPEGNEEDDDISDEDEEEEAGEGNSTFENSYQGKNSEDADSSFENMKKDSKTIFVGNLPKDITKKDLRQLFKKFGKIDTIRIRGIVPKNLNIPKKVAAITKNVHPKLKSVYAYIKFASEKSTTAALALNGTLFKGNHIRVDVTNQSEKTYDGKKSIFLGNLPFKIDENTIRKHFEKCGEIESVRVVKDSHTGIGKGFGYVNFMTEDAVALAFELDGTTILNRNIIVKPYVEDYKSKHRKRSHSSGSDKQNSPRKQLKQNSGKPSPTRNRENTKKGEKEHKAKKQASPQQTNTFQGQKANKIKKKKESPLEKKKKILAKKLTAKPKKPTN